MTAITRPAGTGRGCPDAAQEVRLQAGDVVGEGDGDGAGLSGLRQEGMPDELRRDLDAVGVLRHGEDRPGRGGDRAQFARLAERVHAAGTDEGGLVRGWVDVAPELRVSARIDTWDLVGLRVGISKVDLVPAQRIDPLGPVPPYRQMAAIIKRGILPRAFCRLSGAFRDPGVVRYPSPR
jgi:hypothetical protein